jgi:hypothetical protein
VKRSFEIIPVEDPETLHAKRQKALQFSVQSDVVCITGSGKCQRHIVPAVSTGTMLDLPKRPKVQRDNAFELLLLSTTGAWQVNLQDDRLLLVHRKFAGDLHLSELALANQI